MRRINISDDKKNQAKVHLASLKGKKIETMTDAELRKLLKAICQKLELLDDKENVK